MNRFDEVSTFVDKIHKQLKEQDYINLMKKLSDVRETINERGSDYLVDLKKIIPVLKYNGGNEYKIDRMIYYPSIVFNEKDICRFACADRQFDEDEFLAYRGDCNITDDGQLEYYNIDDYCKDFTLHDSECDNFGTENDSCSCVSLEHTCYTTKIIKIEKL